MVEPTAEGGAHDAVAGRVAPSSVVGIIAMVEQVRALGPGGDDVERIDLLRELERLRCAVEGAQAALTAAFAASQREDAERRGVPAARRDRGIAAQVALARRESPHRAQRHVGLARALSEELPHTFRALRQGAITEWRATLVARDTACLSREDRAAIDRAVAGDVERLEAMGDRELAGEVRSRAARLDPGSVAERRRLAEAERRTTLRPAPDTMTWFTALLPVKDGVAVHAALVAEADRLTASGDPRGRGQIMADTLVERVLRPAVATDTSVPSVPSLVRVPLTLGLVVPESVLLGDEDGAGWVEGFGEVAGDLLRAWVAEAAEAGTQVWLRRLYERPATGELVGLDSRARRFDGGLAAFLRWRDQRCRTPWCNAPVRHLDHVEDHAEGGPTSAVNGQGKCVACNHAKQARGWRARARPGPGRHTVETTTPTGHRYTSTAPDLRAASRGPRPLVIEIHHGLRFELAS